MKLSYQCSSWHVCGKYYHQELIFHPRPCLHFTGRKFRGSNPSSFYCWKNKDLSLFALLIFVDADRNCWTLNMVKAVVSKMLNQISYCNYLVMIIVDFWSIPFRVAKRWKISSKFRKHSTFFFKLSRVFWNLTGIFGKFPEIYWKSSTPLQP